MLISLTQSSRYSRARRTWFGYEYMKETERTRDDHPIMMVSAHARKPPRVGRWTWVTQDPGKWPEVEGDRKKRAASVNVSNVQTATPRRPKRRGLTAAKYHRRMLAELLRRPVPPLDNIVHRRFSHPPLLVQGRGVDFASQRASPRGSRVVPGHVRDSSVGSLPVHYDHEPVGVTQRNPEEGESARRGARLDLGDGGVRYERAALDQKPSRQSPDE